MPRHPPCALKHLFTTRCSHPLCNTQRTTTPQPTATTTTPTSRALGDPGQGPEETPRTGCPLRTQQCAEPRTEIRRTMNRTLCSTQPHPHHPRRGKTSMESRKRRTNPTEAGAGQPHHSVRLLRKEVIQPHLPVRLPCYDFVPIAGPTFDDSLPQGVRPSASGVTNFHDVTGGVYKARERIHRSVADLRLLATPTSRGRVADPDPN
jgi:hypothetical protein